MTCKRHNICKTLHFLNCNSNIGIMIIFKFFNNTPIIVLQKSNFGRYRQQYSIIQTQLKPEDKGCYLLAIKRKLEKYSLIKIKTLNKLYEYIIDLDEMRYFYYMEKDSDKLIPVFVLYKDDLYQQVILNYYLNDKKFDLDKIDHFRLTGYMVGPFGETYVTTINNVKKEISVFAKECISRIMIDYDHLLL